MSKDEGEKERLIAKENEFRVYKRRWYILFVFSLMAMVQGLVWNTYGPIGPSAKLAYGWDNGVISLIFNWGCITYVVLAVGCSYLLRRKGLRLVVVLSAAAMFIGAGLRFVPVYTTWFVHVGQILNGFAGPVALTGPPIVSAVWFPPKERATATSISAMANYLGVVISFLLGPMLVHQPTFFSFLNGTVVNETTSLTAAEWTQLVPSNNSDPLYIGRLQEEIRLYLIIQGACCSLLLFLCVVYFPSQPPSPPAASAAADRYGFSQGCKLVMKNFNFWMLTVTFALATGVFNAFASLFVDVVTDAHVGVDQSTAGWMGFVSQAAGVVAAVVVGRFSDIFQKRMKASLLVFIIAASLLLLWFALVIDRVIPASQWQLYASLTATTMCINSVAPLCYELVVEVTFPIPEAVGTMVMTLVPNVLSIIFLSMLLIPNIGSYWITWTVVASVVVCIPFMLLFRSDYRRLEVDERKSTVNVSS